MSENIEVITNMLPLLATIEEGLNHTKKQLSEIRYEEAFGMLQDVVEGIISIESALKPMKSEIKELQDDEMKQTKLDLNQYINEAVTFYGEGKFNQFEESLKLALGAFIVWRESIELIVRPTIVS